MVLQPCYFSYWSSCLWLSQTLLVIPQQLLCFAFLSCCLVNVHLFKQIHASPAKKHVNSRATKHFSHLSPFLWPRVTCKNSDSKPFWMGSIYSSQNDIILYLFSPRILRQLTWLTETNNKDAVEYSLQWTNLWEHFILASSSQGYRK